MRRPELRLPPPAARLTARPLSRYVLTPDLPWDVQRRRLDRVMGSSPLPRGTTIEPVLLNGVPAEVVTAREARPGVTVLHFHGGGYCVGSARIVRAWAARLSRLASEAFQAASLDEEADGRLGWRWDPSRLASVRHVAIATAVELLSQSPTARLRQCPGDHCGWFFLDATKRGNRRWCSMSECGQEAKTLRRRQRSTAPGGPE